MLGRFGRDASSFLGVEIAPDSIRILQLRRRRGRCSVVAWALEPLVGHVIHDGWIREPEPVIAALRRACQRCGSRQRRVAVAMPGSQVISRVRRLSAEMGEADMEAQLLVEADQFIPFPLEDTALDFQVLGPCADQPDSVEVVVAACRQSQLDPLEQILEAAGLQAELVDIDSHAFQRVMPRRGQDSQALLQLEVDRAVLHAWSGGPLPQRQELRLVVSDPAGRMDSIERWLSYSMQGAPVDVLLVTGAGAGDAELTRALEVRLGTTAQLLEPLAGMDLESLGDADALWRVAPSMALACGLAMGGLR
ncbi:type IV pilus biogenesis protein PilM [Pseudomonas sp. X10]